jgi:hypothetical protein
MSIWAGEKEATGARFKRSLHCGHRPSEGRFFGHRRPRYGAERQGSRRRARGECTDPGAGELVRTQPERSAMCSAHQKAPRERYRRGMQVASAGHLRSPAVIWGAEPATGMVEKSIIPSYGWRHHSVLSHPCVIRTRDASEGAILLLTRGRALAYATQHSPWTPVERACTSYAICSQGKGACGARLDARDCAGP